MCSKVSKKGVFSSEKMNEIEQKLQEQGDEIDRYTQRLEMLEELNHSIQELSEFSTEEKKKVNEKLVAFKKEFQQKKDVFLKKLETYEGKIKKLETIIATRKKILDDIFSKSNNAEDIMEIFLPRQQALTNDLEKSMQMLEQQL